MVFKQPFYSTSSVVASEHPLAPLMGSRILEEGNSIDAVVATNLVLAVTLPHLGGIDGDFFALIRGPNGKVYFVDGGGYAPLKLTREFLLSLGYTSMPMRGPLLINVPGVIDGLRIMWEKWGTIEWHKLVDQAGRIADKGFIVTRSLVRGLKGLHDKLLADPGSMEMYYRNGIPCEGDIVSFKGLAQALKLIGDDPRSFYEGEVAEKIVDYEPSIQEAVKYPRFIWCLWANNADCEEGLNTSRLEGYVLRKKPYPSRLGVAAMVEVKEGIRAGYTDIHGDGVPVGLP